MFILLDTKLCITEKQELKTNIRLQFTWCVCGVGWLVCACVCEIIHFNFMCVINQNSFDIYFASYYMEMLCSSISDICF